MIARFLKETSFAFLIGVFPIIYIYARNIYYIPFEHIIAPVVVVLICSSILLVLFNLVYRNNIKSALLTSIFWLILFSYEAVHSLLQEQIGYTFVTRHTFILLVIAAVFLLISKLLFSKKLPDKIIKVAYAFAIALLLVPALKTTHYLYKEATFQLDSKTGFGDEVDLGLNKNTLPDIVYVILDGYGREDILKKNYDLDNTPFINSLQEKDFFVANRSHSNYCRTAVSAASVFNLNYLHELENFDEAQSYHTLDQLTEESYLVRLLKHYEYNIFSFASGFGITELTSKTTFLTPNPSDLKGFHFLVLNLTPFIVVLNDAQLYKKFCNFLKINSPNSNPAQHFRDHHRDRILFALDSIPAYVGKASPSFVLADIFVGHPPFIFEEDGSYAAPQAHNPAADGSEFMDYNAGGREEYIQGCREQTIYLNNRLLDLVDKIKANITRPTIIVLQGDHGPGAFYHQHDVAQTNLEDRFSILNAIYFSNGIQTDLKHDLTPVNTFRVILNKYFNANLPLLPNRQFYSGVDTPCEFTEVTEALKN